MFGIRQFLTITNRDSDLTMWINVTRNEYKNLIVITRNGCGRKRGPVVRIRIFCCPLYDLSFVLFN